MPRPSARTRILADVGRLVLEQGVGELTLERAAQAAEISKGGLLYHFPTKAALVTALVDDVLDRFETVVDDSATTDVRPAAWAHAYIDATFDAEVSRPDLAAALLVGADVEPDLLERCTKRMDGWHRHLEADGLDPATAALVRYACDGWWTLGALGPATGTEDVAHLRARLHALVEEAVG